MSRPVKLDRWFKLSERNANLRTELIAHTVFVNPSILVDAKVL